MGDGVTYERPDGDLRDLEDGCADEDEDAAEGAALVRPDGFVAWRTGTLPISLEWMLDKVFSSVLCRSTAGQPARTADAESLARKATRRGSQAASRRASRRA
jgi:hypothetical protein